MLILLKMSKTKTLIGTTSIQATATLINILFLNSDLRKRYFTTENSLRLTSYILNFKSICRKFPRCGSKLECLTEQAGGKWRILTLY